jgi:hypothetical protein
MLGLNISASFNSAVTIYVLIPFLLIPQILLSGVIVKFEELNPEISSNSVVPIWGDVMTSRWAFEALAVNQFMGNDYEKNIYAFDKAISYNSYKKVYWFSKMNELINESEDKSANAATDLKILKTEIEKEMKTFPAISFTAISKFNVGAFDANTASETKDYLTILKKIYAENYDAAVKSKDVWMAKFQETETGKVRYEQLMNGSQNGKLEDLVKNVGSDLDEVIVEDGKLIATANPIFRDGSSDDFIRAHFFAPTKSVFGKSYNTYWVNIFVIWCMTLFLWLTLYFDGLKKLLKAGANLAGTFVRKKK